MNQSAIRNKLISKLVQEHCLWSYCHDSVCDIPDEILIEKCLIYLDLDDISSLFSILSFKKIKSVWLSNLVPQDEYYHALNRFFAWYYFGAKHPDSYLKSMYTRQLNKLCKA